MWKCDHFFESPAASVLYGFIIIPNYAFVNKQTSTNHAQNTLYTPFKIKIQFFTGFGLFPAVPQQKAAVLADSG